MVGRADFNPRSPHGERRRRHERRQRPKKFQPTLPARGATKALTESQRRLVISTHAPRTGSDFGRIATTFWTTYFNPRSPHGERQQSRQPEPPAASNFNPRSPHGERHGETRGDARPARISTHAPRTGSDNMSTMKIIKRGIFQPTLPARGATGASSRPSTSSPFQPTLPARGATRFYYMRAPKGTISTHAPRTGSDRSSCGSIVQIATISTHAPRTGSDCRRTFVYMNLWRFQPTLPARGATCRRIADGTGRD